MHGLVHVLLFLPVKIHSWGLEINCLSKYIHWGRWRLSELLVVFKYFHDSFLTVNFDILEWKRERNDTYKGRKQRFFHLTPHVGGSKFLSRISMKHSHIPGRRRLLPTMSRNYSGSHPSYFSRIEDSVFLTLYPRALSLPLECFCWMNDKIVNEGREGTEGVIPVRGTKWDSRSLQHDSHPARCFLGATTGNFKRWRTGSYSPWNMPSLWISRKDENATYLRRMVLACGLHSLHARKVLPCFIH